MTSVIERFLKYVSFDTQSDEFSETCPSTDKQKCLGAALVEEMKAAVNPDKIYVHEDIALVATVGHGMAKNVGTSARLFKALSEAGVNVNMIDQGSSELNIIVGVENKDYIDCLKAIYNEFFN